MAQYSIMIDILSTKFTSPRIPTQSSAYDKLAGHSLKGPHVCATPAMSPNKPLTCLALAISFSPTFCSMMQVTDDGKVKWSKLQFPDGDIGNSMQDCKGYSKTHQQMNEHYTDGYVATYGATVAGLTVTAAAAIKYAANFDDMLAVVRPYIGKKSKLSRLDLRIKI
jgi:hypothetical protein